MVAVAVDTVHSNAQCTRLIQLSSAEVFLVVEVYTGGVLVHLPTDGRVVFRLAAVTTSYIPPSLTSITLDDGVSTVISTYGGETVVLTGTNFGPHTKVNSVLQGCKYSNTAPKNVPTPTAQYKNEIGIIYNLKNCEVKIAHTTIYCTTVVGVGKDFKWQVNVDNQQSLPSSSTTRYKKPVIDKVSGPGAIGSSTRGGDKFYLHGDYFGPTGALHIDLVAYWNDAVQNVFEGIGAPSKKPKSELNARVAQALVKVFDTELI